jgi:hypothetical protein
LLVIFGVGRVRLDRCIVIIVDVLSALLQRVIVNLHHLLMNAPAVGDEIEMRIDCDCGVSGGVVGKPPIFAIRPF